MGQSGFCHHLVCNFHRLVLHVADGGYLEQTAQKDQNVEYAHRHPLRTDEIETMENGQRTERSENINEISIYIFPAQKRTGLIKEW